MSNALCIMVFLGSLASDDFCTAHLDRQLAWRREYGLPLPPANASLVWYVSEPRVSSRMGKKVVEPGLPGLGFSLDGRTVIYDTSKSETVASITSVKPDASLVRDDVYTHLLPFAIACHERGWKPLALAAIRRWTLNNQRWDTEEQIAQDAWHYWECRINDPGTPLLVLAKYLKRTLALSGLDGEYNRALIRSVELAAKPRNSPPDSDDAPIDELIHLGGEEPSPYWWDRGFRGDPRYQAIVRRGLDVVPALIAHLDDQRITRSVRILGGVDNRENLRIHDVVLDMLKQLHGGPFVSAENTQNELIKVIGNWFTDAQKLGEGNYIAAQILGEDEGDREFRQTLFALLTEKYPERVPDVYRELIDTRPGQRQFAWRYSRAIAEGPLPQAGKRKILEYAASKENCDLRFSAVKYLRTVDAKLAHEILLSALAKVPAKADKDESYVAFVTAECIDPTEWKALRVAIRRADPGARLELLQMVSRAKTPEARKHRLALLAEYLTDDAIRDADADHDRFRWSSIAGYRFAQLEVRNFATMSLAGVLKLDAEPTPNWTAEQWAELREEVRAKVKAELQRSTP